jgi:hypothetical protein
LVRRAFPGHFESLPECCQRQQHRSSLFNPEVICFTHGKKCFLCSQSTLSPHACELVLSAARLAIEPSRAVPSHSLHWANIQSFSTLAMHILSGLNLESVQQNQTTVSHLFLLLSAHWEYFASVSDTSVRIDALSQVEVDIQKLLGQDSALKQAILDGFVALSRGSSSPSLPYLRFSHLPSILQGSRANSESQRIRASTVDFILAAITLLQTVCSFNKSVAHFAVSILDSEACLNYQASIIMNHQSPRNRLDMCRYRDLNETRLVALISKLRATYCLESLRSQQWLEICVLLLPGCPRGLEPLFADLRKAMQFAIQANGQLNALSMSAFGLHSDLDQAGIGKSNDSLFLPQRDSMETRLVINYWCTKFMNDGVCGFVACLFAPIGCSHGLYSCMIVHAK